MSLSFIQQKIIIIEHFSLSSFFSFSWARARLIRMRNYWNSQLAADSKCAEFSKTLSLALSILLETYLCVIIAINIILLTAFHFFNRFLLSMCALHIFFTERNKKCSYLKMWVFPITDNTHFWNKIII